MASLWLPRGFAAASRFCSQPSGPLQKVSWDSMLAHVGCMLGHIGSSWCRVGLKRVPDRSMLAPVGFKMPRLASKRFQSVPRWLQNGFIMDPNSAFCSASCSFVIFKNIEKLRKTYRLLRFGAFESINLCLFSEQLSISFGNNLEPLVI